MKTLILFWDGLYCFNADQLVTMVGISVVAMVVCFFGGRAWDVTFGQGLPDALKGKRKDKDKAE
jgi:hypothetical protein